MSNCHRGNNPVIRDPNHELGDCCRPKAAGIKRLDKVPRTLPRRTFSTACEEVLQDEAGFAILNEADASFIHDNLKENPDCPT
jgi:hypothetical protein